MSKGDDILFIINLLSGREKNRDALIHSIKENFPKAEIFVIKDKNEFKECLDKSKNEKYKYIVINGGDGTINSFLPIFIEQKKILGILPSGSGNGLARTLGVPLHPIKALNSIKKFTVNTFDVGKITFSSDKKYYYFSSAMGFGVDADIVEAFEQQKIRGLLGYIIAGIKILFTHRTIKAHVTIDDKLSFDGRFLILSIMNIPQYGNDFYLSPSATNNDGLLNIVILNKINPLLYPIVLLNIIRKREKCPFRYYQAKKIKIEPNFLLKSKRVENNFSCHIDGEPYKTKQEECFEIEILEKQLQVLV